MNRFRREFEKIRQLPASQKLPYLWEYYKIHFLLILFIIFFFLYFIFPVFSKMGKNTLFSLAIIDSTDAAKISTEKLEEEYLSYLQGTPGKNQIAVDASGTSSDTSSSSTIKLTILISSVGENDMIICNQEVYERFNKENAFLDLNTLSGQLPSGLTLSANGTAIDLTNCNKWKEYGYTSYTPVYACIPVSSGHPERAAQFLSYLYGE